MCLQPAAAGDAARSRRVDHQQQETVQAIVPRNVATPFSVRYGRGRPLRQVAPLLVLGRRLFHLADRHGQHVPVPAAPRHLLLQPLQHVPVREPMALVDPIGTLRHRRLTRRSTWRRQLCSLSAERRRRR